MTSDGGFEQEFVKKLNQNSNGNYYAKRFKQHRFSKQICDVVIFSESDKYYSAIECKSQNVDEERLNKESVSSEGKFYFNNHFSTHDNGKHQIEVMNDFIEKGGLSGYLALAYKKGRGKKREYYALEWDKVIDLYNSNDCNGIEYNYLKENGIRLFEWKENGLPGKENFLKLFD